ncbi:MAG: C39 family peptidase [Planctomycetes bacterium]|nr:C39 family peptidase [Planctomycetota bacterium]
MSRRSTFHRTAVILPALIIACTLNLAGGEKYSSCEIEKVPHVRQLPDFCGEACIEMWLRHLGHKTDQKQIFNLSGVAPELARGMVTKEMLATLGKLGFTKVNGGAWIDARKAEKELEQNWALLHADLQKNIPSIICMHYSERENSPEHFRLILGYDSDKDEVIYNEPAEDKGEYRRMKREKLMRLWPLKYNKDKWLLVRMRLEGKKLDLPKAQGGYTPADYSQKMMAIKDRIPKGFAVVIQPPFIVIGDESEKKVQARAERTVKWCCEGLKKLYFSKDPPEIYSVWLFRNKDSYEKYTKLIFGSVPDTPYGYFSSTEGALVMNIGTGGGTLCHEIVHSFVASNFPECPSWFNEGMGSLYEQCGSREGKMVGFTNWRLAGLQEAIKAGKVPEFSELCGTTTREFYNLDRGTNYAQSRYLCYYLQEKCLLVKYYEEFKKNVKDDPSGYKTLQSLLGEKDMKAFKKDWEKWVLKLRFPEDDE